MKTIPALSTLVCTVALLSGAMFLRAAEPKKPCCEPTVEAGKKCEHKCCVSAANEGKVCEKCHPKPQ
jgi:hypothetical protein